MQMYQKATQWGWTTEENHQKDSMGLSLHKINLLSTANMEETRPRNEVLCQFLQWAEIRVEILQVLVLDTVSVFRNDLENEMSSEVAKSAGDTDLSRLVRPKAELCRSILEK